MVLQARVPAGIPTGGRFAAHDRDADTVTLDAPAEPITATTIVDPGAALRIAAEHARSHARRYLFSAEDRDDIAQTAILSVLTSRNNRRVTGLTPGLITNAVSHAVSATIMDRTHVTRHEDARAMTKFNERLEALTQQLGREPTRAEQRHIAESIRAGWKDPRHRPRIDFHSQPEIDDIDQHRGEVESIPSPAEPERDERDELADLVESGAVDKELARRRLWNTVARAEGLPLVGRTSPAEAKGLRRKVVAAGGVSDMARRLLAGELPPADVLRLMAPFHIDSADDARAIAEHLVARDKLAQRLWDSALDAATA